MSLTIIIPVYNTANFLPKCLNSLLKKGRRELLIKNNISILAVNDGSTDNSLEILEQYQNEFPEIISIISQENQGLSVARNNAIKHLTTDFFAFLDSDDWIDLDKFINAYSKIKEQSLDTLVYRLDYYNEENKKTGERKSYNVEYNKVLSGINHLKHGYQPSSVCLMIFKTSLVKDNTLYYYPGITQQDVEYTMRYFLKAKRIIFIDEIVYHYFRRSGSTTMPKTKEKLKKYLIDTIVVAEQIKKNEIDKYSSDVKIIIQKNYNSVIWNLLWRFYKKKGEVSYDFKMECLKELEDKGLYPIKGALKTSFQKITRVLFNQPIILKKMIKN